MVAYLLKTSDPLDFKSKFITVLVSVKLLAFHPLSMLGRAGGLSFIICVNSQKSKFLKLPFMTVKISLNNEIISRVKINSSNNCNRLEYCTRIHTTIHVGYYLLKYKG